MNKKILNKHLLMVILALTILFLATFFSRNPLYLPIHIDEWHHLESSRQIFQGEYDFTVGSYRLGFHILLTPLWFLPHPVLISTILPALFALISGICLYLLIKEMFDKKTAFASILFFTTFTSSFNLLGKDLLVPLGASLSLFFLYLYFFYRWIYKDKKEMKLFYITFFMAGIIYPLSAMVFSPFLLTTLILKKRYKEIIPLGLISIIGLSAIYLIEKSLTSLIFKKGWGVTELINSPTELLSIFVLVLVPFGIWFLIKNKKYFLINFTIMLFVWILFFRIFNFSPIVPYQRVFFYFCTLLLLISISAFYYLTKVRIPIIVFLLLIIALQPSLMKDRNSFIDYYDYNALHNLSQLDKGNVIVMPEQGIAVYPITGMKPLSSIYFNEYFSDSTKEQLISCNIVNVKYAYTDFEIDCGKQIYSFKYKYIYQFDYDRNITK